MTQVDDLRSLTALPQALIPGVLARHGDSSSTVRVGLFDLLIGHQDGPLGLDYLADSLARLEDPDLYHYLVIAMLSARRESLTAVVLQAARFEARQGQIAVLIDSLELFEVDPEIGRVIELLRRRRKPRT